MWPSAHLKPRNVKSENPVNFFGQLFYEDLFVDNLDLGRLNDLKATVDREKAKVYFNEERIFYLNIRIDEFLRELITR